MVDSIAGAATNFLMLYTSQYDNPGKQSHRAHRALNEAKNALSKLTNVKAFIAISHELRTPMNGGTQCD